jgi:hypothetical protein
MRAHEPFRPLRRGETALKPAFRRPSRPPSPAFSRRRRHVVPSTRRVVASTSHAPTFQIATPPPRERSSALKSLVSGAHPATPGPRGPSRGKTLRRKKSVLVAAPGPSPGADINIPDAHPRRPVRERAARPRVSAKENGKRFCLRRKSRFYFRRALSFRVAARHPSSRAETCASCMAITIMRDCVANDAAVEASYLCQISSRAEARPALMRSLCDGRIDAVSLEVRVRGAILCIVIMAQDGRRDAQRSATNISLFDITSIAQEPPVRLTCCPVRPAARSAARSTGRSRRTPPLLHSVSLHVSPRQDPL